MQNSWKKVLLLGAVFISGVLSAQDFVIDPSSIKVSQEFVKAPNFQVSKGYNALPIPPDTYKWLRILVSYVPKTIGAKKNMTVWETGLIAEASVVIPAEPTRGYGKTVLLTGQQVFHSVPGSDTKHYILFLVPPNIFSQYSSLKSFGRNDAEGIPVAIVFRRGNSKKTIATGYSSMKGRSSGDVARIFAGYYKNKVGVLKLEGAILPKEKTPWQWIDTDIFDLPQSITEGNK